MAFLLSAGNVDDCTEAVPLLKLLPDLKDCDIWSRWNTPPDLAIKHWLAAVSSLRCEAAWFGAAFLHTALP